MPLYKPKFLCPNVNMGEKTVDVSLPFKPTCSVDGNVPINAYKIDIMKLTNDGYVMNVFSEDIKCTIAGKLSVPSDKVPLKTSPIYSYLKSSVKSYPSVETKVDENGYLVRPEGCSEGPFLVDSTYHVEYAYVVPNIFFSTGKIPLENNFYPLDNRGRYNTFEPETGIYFSSLPQWFLVSEFVECVEDEKLTLSYDVYSKDDMVIYSLRESVTNGNEYIEDSIANVTFDKNMLTDSSETNYVFCRGTTYLVTYRATNISTEPYKYSISFWDTSNVSDVPTVSSDYAVFYANALPTVKIYADGLEITKSVSLDKRSCMFSIDYQDDYSSIKWYGWKLVNTISGEVIHDTISSNNIYGSVGNINFSYSGFISGQEYEISFTVVTQNNMSVTKTAKINVQYDLTEVSVNFISALLPDECGIMCDWSNIKVASGSSYGNHSYIDNYPVQSSVSLKLYEKSCIYYQKKDESNFSVYDSSYILLSFQYRGTDTFKDIELLSLSSSQSDSDSGLFTKSIYVNSDSKLSMKISRFGQVVAQTTSDASLFGEKYWNFILLKPNGNIVEVIYEAIGASTPLENLALSSSLSLNGGTWVLKQANEYECNVNSDYSLPLDLYYKFMSLGSSQNKNPFVCDFVCMTKDEISQSDLTTKFISDAETDLSTRNFDMFSKFNHSLNAGNTLIESLDEFEIRRSKNANSYTDFVTNVHSINTNFIIDYMVCNNNSYSYYLYPKNEKSIMYPIMSNEVKTCWDQYCLMVVDESDEENLFYLSKMFVFNLNLNAGDMSNNTDIEVVKNFTPYPTVQVSPSNYWSGTLSSLIGFIKCGGSEMYKQTPQMMAELKSLTTDTRRKFLKDIEGNIFEVQISNELRVSNDEGVIDSVRSVAIDWAEVGNINGISVVNNPDMMTNTWLLTNNGVVSPYLNYVWDDKYLWDDSKYWTGNHGVLSVE